ncbi:hypothetical protein [Paracidovorax cattleyae]|uniref:Uncharacterized protein n=1 Tax=Paracidovorax cattleyae TaxID=80868 RepID=A0A1H0REF3_9BURK|nr:hypothetical protein [Paracidovorax cattleyae]SDP27943.1 hypothetical protein SAMN04489708_11029 [Paracidovorax cattleyae]
MTENTTNNTAAPAATQPEALRLAAWLNEGAWHRMTLGDVNAAARELRRLHALTTAPAASLVPLNDRAVLDAIRGAYDLGYNDARNARTVPGDSAPGYKGREVEQDHGGALIHTLSRRLAAPAAQEAEPADPSRILADPERREAARVDRETLAKRLIGEVVEASAIASRICREVAELPDRNSPPDWPQAMLVTSDELHQIVRETLIAVAPRPQADAGAVPVPRKLLEDLAPEQPMNQDEQGGCVWCCGSAPDYAGAEPEDHDADCPWLLARGLLAAAPQAPAAATESVLINGVAYRVPAAVAGELLRLHMEALTAPTAAVAPAGRAQEWAWHDEVMKIAMVASTAMHQSPADQRNILEDIADQLTALGASIADGRAAASTQEAAPLTEAELLEVQRAVEDFGDCGETVVDYELLLRTALASYLECTRFQVLNRPALDRAIDAARWRQEGGAA